MNETEAIENLEYFIGGDCCDNQMDFLEEIRMGIAALREQAERVLCAKCKHYNKTGCSAGFGWCENMDRGTHDEFYCASGKRLEVEHEQLL